ncbi:MAG: methyltransferase [Deltaproteobacteria bacterium]
MDYTKNRIPWWLKIGSKIILSRLPIKYTYWKKLKLFELGGMDKPQYSFDVITEHMKRAGLKNLQDKTVLEMGPGDSLFTVLIANAYGAKKIYLVDVKDFAAKEIGLYKNMANFLKSKGLNAVDISNCTNIKEVMSLCNAEYLTQGLDSYKTIPGNSIDFAFSQAVLEHIRKQDFLSTFKEIKRVAQNCAVSSHYVDLKDHLDGSLNNLRFSEKCWESDFMVKSGFYTNRIRYAKMLKLFKEAGFSYEVINFKKYEKMPIARNKLADEFGRLTDDELNIMDFEVVLY